MNIKSVGLDFETASVFDREQFSFNMDTAIEGMLKICDDYGASGAVILSTCNRTELYVSGLSQHIAAGEILCAVKDLSYGKYRYLLKERDNNDTIDHIMEMSCGIKSQIWGEDQILSQVKNAIALSRDNKCSDPLLEQLFQTAITAAKRVKSTVRLTNADNSVATATISKLKDVIGELNGVPVMIIGNGEMGKLMARSLVYYNADVTVTIRQYHRGEVTIPSGCGAIPYDQRIAFMNKVKVVISATTSPHYTIKHEDISDEINHQTCFIDLAVPRDIDPEIALLPNAIVYDVDDLSVSEANINDEALVKAREIIAQYKENLLEWKDFRKMIPIINEIKEMIASDIVYQLQNTDSLEEAGQIAVEKVLIALKDNLDSSLWEDCYDGLRKSSIRR